MINYLKEKYRENFKEYPQLFFDAPGRTELGGNHTDHQHGKVLAASVEMKIYAAVVKRDDSIVDIISEEYGHINLDISDTEIHKSEKATSTALVRGMAKALNVSTGFNAYIKSEIPMGSGVSSSAAFEVLIGRIMMLGTEDAVKIAKAGQFAENNYYGKPSGLMDQMASSIGGIIAVDFKDPENPEFEKIEFDFEKAGYRLLIVPCGSSHENLTDEYASIPKELGEICKYFGKEYLRDVNENEFYAAIPELRESAGDRAVLRAIHVFNENKRVDLMVKALKENNIEKYLELVRESGRSSFEYLQNLIPTGSTRHQEMALTLALAEKQLAGRGACRIHGGGFAGTIQVYAPLDMDFVTKLF